VRVRGEGKGSSNRKALSDGRYRRDNEVQQESPGLEGPRMKKEVKGTAWRCTRSTPQSYDVNNAWRQFLFSIP